jgi:hypothetical protein
MSNPPIKTDDEKRFNDTLKRMLKTPPKPHEQGLKRKGDSSGAGAGKANTNKSKSAHGRD